MIEPEMFNCLLTDVIKNTLAGCDYTKCSEYCMEYLFDVADNCEVVFHNGEYLRLWNTLISICFPAHLEKDPYS